MVVFVCCYWLVFVACFLVAWVLLLPFCVGGCVGAGESAAGEGPAGCGTAVGDVGLFGGEEDADGVIAGCIEAGDGVAVCVNDVNVGVHFQAAAGGIDVGSSLYCVVGLAVVLHQFGNVRDAYGFAQFLEARGFIDVTVLLAHFQDGVQVGYGFLCFHGAALGQEHGNVGVLQAFRFEGIDIVLGVDHEVGGAGCPAVKGEEHADLVIDPLAVLADNRIGVIDDQGGQDRFLVLGEIVVLDDVVHLGDMGNRNHVHVVQDRKSVV